MAGEDNRTQSSRRRFLQLGVAMAGGAVALAVVPTALQASGLTGKIAQKPGTTKPQFSVTDVRNFFGALKSPQAQAFFMLSVTTGLKKNVLLSLKISDLDMSNRMLTPRLSAGASQKSWVAFYNEEAAEYVSKYVQSLPSRVGSAKLFPSSSSMKTEWAAAQKTTGLSLKVRNLRKVYRGQMSANGVLKTYVSALRGKALKSSAAGPNIDLSAENLKQVYDGARLKILSD
jgi:integrase